MPFNKSLIVVASTRYEIGRHDPRRWKAWNANLKAIAAHPRNVVAANNRYDAEYVKYFTGLKHVPVLPNYCGWRCGNQPRVDGVASPRHRAGAGRPTFDVPPTSRRWRQRDVTPPRRRRRGRQRVYASRERAAAVSRRCPCHAAFSTSCPHVTTSHAAHLRRSRRCIMCTRSFIHWRRPLKPGSPTTSRRWPSSWSGGRTGGTRW